MRLPNLTNSTCARAITVPWSIPPSGAARDLSCIRLLFRTDTNDLAGGVRRGKGAVVISHERERERERARERYLLPVYSFDGYTARSLRIIPFTGSGGSTRTAQLEAGTRADARRSIYPQP